MTTAEPDPVSLAVGFGGDRREIAVLVRRGRAPGVFWLGGFRSDMVGRKATAVDAFAVRRGLAMTRFDYSGHGRSGGRFEDGTITRWLAEAGAVLKNCTAGPQVLVGSSMGGWLALLLAAGLRSGGAGDRVAGMVLIAPAVDMTRALMWERMSGAERTELMAAGAIRVASPYADEPYLLTRALIEDGDRHLFGNRLIETGCPVHIIQGIKDRDVPFRHAMALVSRLASDDVVLTLVKDGDHRLSRPEDLDRLMAALAGIVDESYAGGVPFAASTAPAR